VRSRHIRGLHAGEIVHIHVGGHRDASSWLRLDEAHCPEYVTPGPATIAARGSGVDGNPSTNPPGRDEDGQR